MHDPRSRARASAVWTGAAVATAILIAVVTGVFNQGPSWRISAARGSGEILLDGVPLSASDTTAIGRRVPAGVRIQVAQGAELDLRSKGALALRLAGGTDLILPPPPPRWFARRSEAHVRQGEITVTTGPAFIGARFYVSTPEATVEASGTTFSVALDPTGTRVCASEGTIQVGPRDSALTPLAEGGYRYLYKGRRKPLDGALFPDDRAALAAFRDAQRPYLLQFRR